MTRRELLRLTAAAGIGVVGSGSAGASRAAAAPETWPPPGYGGSLVPPPPRTPRFPLKTARTLTSASELARARERIARYPAARSVRDQVVKAAAPWLAWEDADLARLVTPAAVPRAFDVGASIGCPKCGKTIHEKFGTYPWLVDLKKPFRLTCPVDGSVYPDNDYAAYLRSGFKNRDGWDRATIVDDGWGWKNPANGERYWFVAHYNHRVYHHHLLPGVAALGQAYLLTGDTRYAHKAAVILYHLAVVYPSMDYEKQSRFGLMTALEGGRYPGKLLNHIWECQVAVEFASAYDAVWETLDRDTALQQATGMTGPALRAFIEANLLEDAVDAYDTGRIRGNFGMHQNALGHVAIARQHGDNDRWLGGLLTAASSEDSCTGIEYARYNLVYRDGFPSETSPDYNFLWLASLSSLGELLAKGGRDLFASPRMRRMYAAVLDQINCGKFSPDLGDAGSVYGALEGADIEVFQIARAAYPHDARIARFLASIGGTGAEAFSTYGALFRDLPTVESSAKPTRPPQRARVFDGYGLAVLSDPADTVSLSLYYGLKAGHGHFDRLGFELFAAGQPVMPDLGYPDAMNGYVPGIFTWSKNTISHNTVVVDAGRQTGNVPGTVRLFADGKTARVVDIDAAGTYPQASTYRRALLMVDTGAGSYYLDVFDVAGGSQHDYSLHGPPGTFALAGADAGAWGAPEPGTLAGPDVPLGQIYDDPKLAAKDYKGVYTGYTGSGFQHLYNVRRYNQATNGGTGGDWVAEWHHEKDHTAGLRLRVMPQTGQELILANAHVSPVKFPQELQYVIARRKGTGLTSRFVSVIEPFHGSPLLAGAERLPLAAGDGVAVRARRADGRTDILLYGPAGDQKRLAAAAGVPGLTTDARAAVVTLGPDRSAQRVFFAGGTSLTIGGKTHRAAPPVAGTVVAVAPDKGTVQIRLDSGSGKPASSGGGSFAFHNAHGRRALHPVTAAVRDGKEGALWTLTIGDDLRIGRAHVASATAKSVQSDVALPLGITYAGASLCDPAFAEFHPIAGAASREITLANSLPAGGGKFAPGGDAWIVSVAPGDRVEVPTLYEHADAGGKPVS